MKSIVIFGANSFLGKLLVDFFQSRDDYSVIAVTRSSNHTFPNKVKHLLWDGEHLDDWADELLTVDYVVNLAGKSVNCRYNEKNKAAIFSSRLRSTEIIGKALEKTTNVKAWLNMSSATIYAHSLKIPNTESSGIIGTGFSVDVCKQWESQFFSAKTQANLRKVALRSTIVLGKNGGVLPVIKKLAHFGLGGRMGNGEQYFSWIHEEDFCRSIHFLLENEQINGPVNLASPYPVKNNEFQFSIRISEGIRWYVNQPRWMLEMGAKFIQTETELVLKSRYVLPEKLVQSGFQFKHPNLLESLQAIY